jgi:hypothetical protein
VALPSADELAHAFGLLMVAAAAKISRLFRTGESKRRDHESLSHRRDHRVQLGNIRPNSEGRLSAAAAIRKAGVASELPAEGQLSMILSYFQ